MGDQIPLGARIIHVVDAYVAMTHPTAYRDAFEPRVALQRMFQAAGSQFDPVVLNAFLNIIENAPSDFQARMEDYLEAVGLDR
jgi:HD-GYP domain-containing protein (c-di-GMP phosphodiesterase class II)